jgi:hypothetical protein
MDKKIILFAAAAGIMLATGTPALAQGEPDGGYRPRRNAWYRRRGSTSGP